MADLFQLRAAVDGDRVVLLAWLDALRVADSTVVSVAFDVDGVAGQPALPWPHTSGLRAAGADVVVTAWGTGADVVDLRTGKVTRIGEVAANTRVNAIEVAVPARLLPGGRWRLWAATGLWDGPARTFVQVPSGKPTATRPGNGGGGAVGQAFNVAFRDREGGPYYESRQADALRTGDVTLMSWSVVVARMRQGASDRLPTPRPGELQAVIVDEGRTLGPFGEGASFFGIPGRQSGFGPLQESVGFEFYGRWQPYSLYVPRSYDPAVANPSTLVLHGHGGSHASYNRQPGFLRDMGEGGGSLPGLVLITPLARGGSFYVDDGERSTLLALDDAARRLSLDPDRQYLTGYSMGGYGVFRLAVRYPDRWAAAVSWAGYTGEFLGTFDATKTFDGSSLSGPPAQIREEVVAPLIRTLLHREPGPIENQSANGDPVRALESLVNLPILQLGGTNDEIVPVTGQLAAATRLDQLGYRHRFDLYPGYEHLTFALVDQWTTAREFLGDQRRPVHPRHVVVATSPAWISPSAAKRVALPADAAWWVSGIGVRAGSDDVRALGRVDATSFGIADRRHDVVDITEVAALPTPNLRVGQAWRATSPERIANRLELTLANVADLSVDLVGAHLDPRCLTIVVTTDGPAVLRLPGTRVLPITLRSAGRRTFGTPC